MSQITMTFSELEANYVPRAELTALKAELAEKSGAMSVMAKMHNDLVTQLASARAVIAVQRKALEYVKESLEGRVGAEYVDRLDDLKLIDEALTAPASGDNAATSAGGPNAGTTVVPNDGTTNEEVLRVLVDRLNYLQAKFPCRENALAITKLEEAQHWLAHRTANRKARGVEGKQIA